MDAYPLGDNALGSEATTGGSNAYAQEISVSQATAVVGVRRNALIRSLSQTYRAGIRSSDFNEGSTFGLVVEKISRATQSTVATTRKRVARAVTVAQSIWTESGPYRIGYLFYKEISTAVFTARNWIPTGMPLGQPVHGYEGIGAGTTETNNTTLQVVAQTGIRFITATQSTTASIRKRVYKTRSVTQATSASIRKAVFKTLRPVVTTATTIRKSVAKRISASFNVTASLTKHTYKTFSKTIPILVTLHKSAGKRVNVYVATVTTLSRRTYHIVRATVVTSATRTRSILKRISIIVFNSVSRTNATNKTIRILSPGVTSIVRLTKLVRKVITDIEPTVASLTRKDMFLRTVSFAQGSTVSLSKYIRKQLSLNTVSTPTLHKSALKTISLTFTKTISLRKMAGKNFAPGVLSVVTIHRGIYKTIRITEAFQAALHRTALKSLSRAVSTGVSIRKSVGKIIHAAMDNFTELVVTFNNKFFMTIDVTQAVVASARKHMTVAAFTTTVRSGLLDAGSALGAMSTYFLGQLGIGIGSYTPGSGASNTSLTKEVFKYSFASVVTTVNIAKEIIKSQIEVMIDVTQATLASLNRLVNKTVPIAIGNSVAINQLISKTLNSSVTLVTNLSRITAQAITIAASVSIPTFLRKDVSKTIVFPNTEFPATSTLDNFNRVENPLSDGGKWTKLTNGASFETNGSVAYSYSSAGYIRNDKKYNDSEVYFTIGNPIYNALLIRFAKNFTGYLVEFSSGSLQIYRYDPTEAVSIAGFSNTTIAPGDVIGARVKGNEIEVYLNGTLVRSATDTTYSSGYVGFIVYSTNPSDGIDNFGGGSIPGIVTSLSKNASKTIYASGNIVPTLTKRSYFVLRASLSSTARLTKSIQKKVRITVATATRRSIRVLKQLRINTSGVVTVTNLIKLVLHNIVDLIPITTSLIVKDLFFRTLSYTQHVNASVSRRVGKSLEASTGTSILLRKQINKARLATSSSVVSIRKSVRKAIVIGNITLASTSRAIKYRVAAPVAISASLTKTIIKSLGASVATRIRVLIPQTTRKSIALFITGFEFKANKYRTFMFRRSNPIETNIENEVTTAQRTNPIDTNLNNNISGAHRTNPIDIDAS